MRRLLAATACVLALLPVRTGWASDLAPSTASTPDSGATAWWSDLGEGSATVADTVTRAISVATEPGVVVEWPAALAVGGDLGGLTIVAVRERPLRIDERGRVVATREIDLEPFLPGVFEVGPLEFTVRREGEPGATTLTLGAARVAVAALLPADSNNELVGPKGVVTPPASDARDWTPWVIAGATSVGLAAALLATTALRSKRTREPTPSQRALAALTLLDDRVRGEAHVGRRPTNDEAYTGLSAILRRYIEGRFEYRATVRTTEEFLRDAADRRSGLPSEAAAHLRGVLEACDEVKFGGAEPGLAAAGRAIDQAAEFVRRFGNRKNEEEGA